MGDNFHLVDEENGIWEFSKGDLRAIGFDDHGRHFVVSNVLMKKTKKVDPRAVAQAVRDKKKYEQAKADKTISYGMKDDAQQ